MKMMESIRKRSKPAKEQNGTAKYEDKYKDTDFAVRESPLTLLLKDSAHLRAIYHIFIVILMILFCDTLIFDLLETGKINVGLQTVAYGFGDVSRGLKLWLYLFSVAVIFHPLLLIYGFLVKRFVKISGTQKLWQIIGAIGLIAIQCTLFSLPMWDLSRQHLALGSSVAVTCEMFRYSMKIHAAAMTCGPRCFGDGLPLPTFQQYMYFLFAPTLLYRDQYPRTKRIRWGVVASHFMEVVAIVFYNSFMWERFILPYWSDFGKETSIEVGTVVRGMFACVLPGVISFLCGFYCLLHAWCNAFAEMLKFGDRLFYEEWWTASRFSKFFRLWNRVVHSWLRDHMYVPLAPRAGRAMSTFIVFFIAFATGLLISSMRIKNNDAANAIIESTYGRSGSVVWLLRVSAVAHEVVLALSFGFFYPVLLMQFGVFGVLMLPVTSVSGKLFPNALNMFMWLTFFIGNGMLWSLYPMEYFARKNCPPSEHDSFFIPKSWSCPKVILKPDWSFKNPFQLNQ